MLFKRADRPRTSSVAHAASLSQLDLRHQVSKLNPQGSRQRLDRLQADRPLPSFDQADVGPMEPSGVRQSLLTQF